MTNSIYDKYEIEEVYSKLVDEIVKVIHEEYETEEVINDFEDEDFEDILSSYDYDKWIVAMYFLDDPKDIEEEGWDFILEQFIEDIRESFIDKYENEEENYIKIEDMGMKKNASGNWKTLKAYVDITPKEFKTDLQSIKEHLNLARASKNQNEIISQQDQLEQLINKVLHSYISDRDNYSRQSPEFAKLKTLYLDYILILEDYIYDFKDNDDRALVKSLISKMEQEIANY